MDHFFVLFQCLCMVTYQQAALLCDYFPSGFWLFKPTLSIHKHQIEEMNQILCLAPVKNLIYFHTKQEPFAEKVLRFTVCVFS